MLMNTLTKHTIKGRPLGSQTTVKIKISELFKYFSEEAEIPVAKAFLDAIGINYKQEAPKR
jgi:hypothetical protein